MWSYSSVYPGARISQCPHPPELPEEYEVYCQRFELGGQSGTYIETKAHVDPSAMAVSDCPVGEFVMNAAILRVEISGPQHAVSLDDLRAAGQTIQPDDAVIIVTGWDKHWAEPTTFIEGSPYIAPDAAHWLFERHIRCLAADFPRFDRVRQPCFPWQDFWTNVPYLLAPVCNIYRESFVRARLFAFPLKIRGAMGTPVRAVLEVAD